MMGKESRRRRSRRRRNIITMYQIHTKEGRKRRRGG
jgi:hypothetical protein